MIFVCLNILFMCLINKLTPYWPGEEHPRQTHGILTVELLREKPGDIANVTEYDLTVCITTDVRT